MRILVDGEIYRQQVRGGISRLFNEILPRMCQTDESLSIKLLTTGRLLQQPPSHPGIAHRRVPEIRRFLRPRLAWKHVTPHAEKAVRYMWTGKPSGAIWHSTYYTMPVRWDGPQVTTVHDLNWARFPDLFGQRKSEEWTKRILHCARSADAVICVSEATRADLQGNYGLSADKISVVPHGYSPAFRRLERQPTGRDEPVPGPFLLYVGSRAEYKQFSTLAAAYSAWSRRTEVDLVVVGQRWSRQETTMIAELGISNRVRLLENVDDETLCALYNSAEAFVYPSLYEGFGIPLLEAMACGCPIVASDIPTTHEVAGTAPVYFEPGEVESLSSALDTAIDERRGSKRTTLGLERVTQYSWDKTAAMTMDVYRRVSHVTDEGRSLASVSNEDS